MTFDDLDLADDHDEPRPRRSRLIRCHDGMCGATDCPRCYPGATADEPETEEVPCA